MITITPEQADAFVLAAALAEVDQLTERLKERDALIAALKAGYDARGEVITFLARDIREARA